MKKLVSLLLAFSIAMALGTTALAADKKDSKEPKQPKEPKQQEEIVRPTEPRPNAPEVNVTAAEATQAALDAAGYTRSEVKGLHTYKLYDCGNAYAYRVEFGVYDRETRVTTVFSYNVDITTGAVA